ncbi:MAG: hypothetical protein ACI4ES_02950 [Roseburia sp.]
MKKNTIIFIIIVACLLVGIGIYSYHSGKEKEKVEYTEVLDRVAVTVDGTNLTIRDMAFYIAYEESTVEEQALVYDAEDTNAYWNLHINGEFVKISARTATMDMAVHDEIFYQMALAEKVVLSEEEESILKERQNDFWTDLSEEAKERIEVSEEELNKTMEKMALAQKYQMVYASMQGASYEDYEFNGERYKELQDLHEVEINDSIWNRLDFGNITLEH